MGSDGRRGLLGAALVLALLTGGCGKLPQPPAATLRAGFDTVDGPLRVWPARGGLATDPQATAAISRAVADWRTPTDDRAYLPSSGILWLGEAGGSRLALVAATVPGNGASWLLQLGGEGSDFRITRTAEYTDPGYLVYSDVLPVQLSDGRHYLTSARVDQLLGPDGQPLQISDGLSGPVDVPGCSPVTVTASLRATTSLPQGKPGMRVVDLGTGIQDPRYPMVGDDSDTAGKALEGLDTCALAGDKGPFGSIGRRLVGKPAPGLPPSSWPIDRVTTRSLGKLTLGSAPPAELSQLTWRTDSGVMTAAVLRSRDAAPVVSRADRVNTLQVYQLTVGGQPYAVLVWRPVPDSNLSLPPGTSPVVDRPGLVVITKPDPKQTISLATPDKTYYRSVDD